MTEESLPSEMGKPVEVAPAPPETTPDSLRSDVVPDPTPEPPKPEPIVFKTWDQAGRPKLRVEDGKVVQRGWPAAARQPDTKFCVIRPGQQLINPRRRKKNQMRRQLPVGISKQGKDGVFHRSSTRQGLSGRQWRMFRKDLGRHIKRQMAEQNRVANPEPEPEKG